MKEVTYIGKIDPAPKEQNRSTARKTAAIAASREALLLMIAKSLKAAKAAVRKIKTGMSQRTTSMLTHR